jgi:hypothetical protein
MGQKLIDLLLFFVQCIQRSIDKTIAKPIYCDMGQRTILSAEPAFGEKGGALLRIAPRFVARQQRCR